VDEYTTHVERWLPLFPLEAFADHELRGTHITSPSHLVLVERLRTLAGLRSGQGGIPVDVFVQAIGEPARRDVTKVGGLPYRPADKPWPITPSGQRMTFVAQYRFAESRDIVGELPGDVLLVFMCDDDLVWPDEPWRVVFEWYPLGLDNLVERVAIPEPGWMFVTCYGVRCRTIDYVDEGAPKALQAILPREVTEELPPEVAALNLCRLEGMKVGGAPMWPLPDQVDARRDLPGRFLCSLATIQPRIECPFPWTNHRDPIELDFSFRKDTELYWRDGAIVNVSIDEHNHLHWVAQFW